MSGHSRGVSPWFRTLTTVLAVALGVWGLGLWSLFVGSLVADRVVDEIRANRVAGGS